MRIEGGSHCYFGNYGQQAGDPAGQITREDQQNITALTTFDFLIRN